MTIPSGRLAVACGQFITIPLSEQSQCLKSALRPISQSALTVHQRCGSVGNCHVNIAKPVSSPAALILKAWFRKSRNTVWGP